MRPSLRFSLLFASFDIYIRLYCCAMRNSQATRPLPVPPLPAGGQIWATVA